MRHPLAFDWPVAARLKPSMSLTSWLINPWSRIAICSQSHPTARSPWPMFANPRSRSSASRADGAGHIDAQGREGAEQTAPPLIADAEGKWLSLPNGKDWEVWIDWYDERLGGGQAARPGP